MKEKAKQFLDELESNYEHQDIAEYTRLTDALECFINCAIFEETEDEKQNL